MQEYDRIAVADLELTHAAVEHADAFARQSICRINRAGRLVWSRHGHRLHKG